jgi:hypothetical protein
MCAVPSVTSILYARACKGKPALVVIIFSVPFSNPVFNWSQLITTGQGPPEGRAAVPWKGGYVGMNNRLIVTWNLPRLVADLAVRLGRPTQTRRLHVPSEHELMTSESDLRRCIQCGGWYGVEFFYCNGRGGMRPRCIGCMMTRRHNQKRERLGLPLYYMAAPFIPLRKPRERELQAEGEAMVSQ